MIWFSIITTSNHNNTRKDSRMTGACVLTLPLIIMKWKKGRLKDNVFSLKDVSTFFAGASNAVS